MNSYFDIIEQQAARQPRGYFDAVVDPQFWRDMAGNTVGLLGVPLPTERESMARLSENQRMQAPEVNVHRMMTDPATQQQLSQGWDEKMNQLGLLGLTVYHGSPHKFDKFDSSKIGTGEGAQAYGHGLYLAENPGVAQSYKNANPQVVVSNKTMSVPMWSDAKTPEQLAAAAYWKLGDNAKASDYLYRASKTGEIAGEKINKTAAAKAMKMIDDGLVSHTGGNLYTVDLPDDQIAKMLDWDKPLSQQPESVRKILVGDPSQLKAFEAWYAKRTNGLGEPFNWNNLSDKQQNNQLRIFRAETGMDVPPLLMMQKNMNGARWHDVLAQKFGGQDKAAEWLNSQGIPGIKYLDAGSRAAGEGSRNFVVFPGNEGLLKILGRE